MAHGLGLILANLAQAGIHLERREHEPAAALLAAARDAARINGRPALQAMVDTWMARLATAQGDRAGALASLAQARLALAAPDDRVRAQFALEEFRIALALAPAQASALVSRLPASTASGLLQARLHVRSGSGPRPRRSWRQWSLAPSASGWNGGSCGAWRPRHPTWRGRTATCGRPWRWPSPTGTWPPSSSRDPALPPCSVPCRPAPISSPTSMSCRSAQRQSRPQPKARRAPGGVLSGRELTVLRLLASRLTTTEIAGALYVSANTLKSHLKSIYRKLDVSSRANAVREGEALGLI